MSLRDSLHGAADGVSSAAGAVDDIGDYQSVDQTPGVFARTLGVIVSLWWVFVVVVGVAAISFPYLFPQWANDYKNELKGINIATNSAKLLQATGKVKWLKAFNKANLRYAGYVGTGLHPVLRKNKALKKDWFYTGEVLMMKTYVSDYDMATSEERAEWDKKNALKLPAIGVEHTEAAAWCSSLGKGHRLPSYNELAVASVHFIERNAQGKVGETLKPNLDLKLFESKALWTSTLQSSGGWFESLRKDDNFRVFFPGKDDVELYLDDGDESEELGFLCVREVD